jgi:xanthosine utilization system XapX-like protein
VPAPPAGSGTTASPAAKFAIGLLAGSCAVMLPRVLALVSQGDETQIVFLPAPYFLLALGAGLFLGLVMLVIEYEVPAKPRETFMAALGIPAIVTGALGTASTSAGLSEVANDAARLRQVVAQEQGIAKQGSFSDMQTLGLPAAAQKPPAKASSFLPAIIGIAHAQDSRAAPAHEPLRFGIRVEQPKYVVVLEQAKTEQEALRKAGQLGAQLPSARAVKANNAYFVVLGAPAGETDALLAAKHAKKTLGAGARPVLVEIR